MAEESAKLRIPYIAAAQAQKHVTHNEAMTLLDTLVQLSVLDKDLTAPPVSPTEGDCYIVAGAGGTATGAWVGWEQRVARYLDGEWRSYLPGEGAGAGWLAWVLDEDAMYRFDGAAWALAGLEGPAGPEGAPGADGQSFQPDAVVPLISGRTAYDDEAAAFSVLIESDSGNDGKPTLYFKLTAGSADWSDGITWLPQAEGGGGVPPKGHLFGLTLSNNATDATNDVDIAPGQATDGDGDVLMELSSSLSKRLDASWSAGNGNGGLDTGTIANTTYHVFLIRRSDTGVVDALFSASATSPTLPADYDQKRRIGSILRESGAIVGFVQRGNYFRRSLASLDVDSTNPGTSGITAALKVPTGIAVTAETNVRLRHTGTLTRLHVSPLVTANEAPSASDAPLGVLAAGSGFTENMGQWTGLTDISGQVRYRVDTSDGSTIVRIATLGWTDRRGRDS